MHSVFCFVLFCFLTFGISPEALVFFISKRYKTMYKTLSRRRLLKYIWFQFQFSCTSRLGKGYQMISAETLTELGRLTQINLFHEFIYLSVY